MEQNESQFPRPLEALVVVGVTIVIMMMAATIGALFLRITEIFLMEIFTIIPALVYVLMKRYPVRQLFRFRMVSPRVILTTIVIGFSSAILTDELDRLIQIILPMPPQLLEAIEKLMQVQNLTELSLIFLAAVIIAAIGEEMLFRGFLQHTLESYLDITLAVILSAVIFGVFHLNPWWSIQITTFGVILGVLAWKSNSIIPSAIVHGINNGLALFFVNVEPSKYQWYLWKGHVAPAILVICGVAIYFGFKMFYNFCAQENNVEFKAQQDRDDITNL